MGRAKPAMPIWASPEAAVWGIIFRHGRVLRRVAEEELVDALVVEANKLLEEDGGDHHVNVAIIFANTKGDTCGSGDRQPPTHAACGFFYAVPRRVFTLTSPPWDCASFARWKE